MTVTRRSETISRFNYSLKLTEAQKTPFSQPLSRIYFAGLEAIRPISLAKRSYLI